MVVERESGQDIELGQEHSKFKEIMSGMRKFWKIVKAIAIES